MNPWEETFPRRNAISDGSAPATSQEANQRQGSHLQAARANQEPEASQPVTEDNHDNNIPRTTAPSLPSIYTTVQPATLPFGGSENHHLTGSNVVGRGHHAPPSSNYGFQPAPLQSQYLYGSSNLLGAPTYPNATVSAGHGHMLPTLDSYAYQLGRPIAQPLSTAVFNPYRARARMVGRYHGIPEITGYIAEDFFDPPPPWREGDDPITPGAANMLHANQLEVIKQQDEARRKRLETVTGQQRVQLRSESERRWISDITLLNLQLRIRIAVWEEWRRPPIHGGHIQALRQQQLITQQMVPTIGPFGNVNWHAPPTAPYGTMPVLGHAAAAQRVQHRDQAPYPSNLYVHDPLRMTTHEAMAGWRPAPQILQTPANVQSGPGLIRREMDAAYNRAADASRSQRAMDPQYHVAAGHDPDIDPRLLSANLGPSLMGATSDPNIDPSLMGANQDPNIDPSLMGANQDSNLPTSGTPGVSYTGTGDNVSPLTAAAQYRYSERQYPEPSLYSGPDPSWVGIQMYGGNTNPGHTLYPLPSNVSGSSNQNTGVTGISNQQVGLAPSSRLPAGTRTVPSSNADTGSGVPASDQFTNRSRAASRARPAWTQQLAEAGLPTSTISQQALDAGRQWRESQESGSAPPIKKKRASGRRKPKALAIPAGEQPSFPISERAAHHLVSKGFVSPITLPALAPKPIQPAISSQNLVSGTILGTIGQETTGTPSARGNTGTIGTIGQNLFAPANAGTTSQPPMVSWSTQNLNTPVQVPVNNNTGNNGRGAQDTKSKEAKSKNIKRKKTKTNEQDSGDSTVSDVSTDTPDDQNDNDYDGSRGGSSSRKRKAGGTPSSNKRARA
ncbi:MAG: hypothetical protein M1816_000817 [Peltula sp. TS41687]|nr:MAG: hypothetical protein M1816_000817 [Peltula sp. TS41687]